MKKSVLLARPHPFLVTRMKSFLIECGLAAVELTDVQDIESVARFSRGAVIGLGGASTLAISHSDVFARILRAAPALPIIFSSMFDARQSERAVRALPTALGFDLRVSNIEDYDPAMRSYVHLTAGDLEDRSRRQLASEIARRHFAV